MVLTNKGQNRRKDSLNLPASIMTRTLLVSEGKNTKGIAILKSTKLARRPRQSVEKPSPVIPLRKADKKKAATVNNSVNVSILIPCFHENISSLRAYFTGF
jgi:hypothetical protein